MKIKVVSGIMLTLLFLGMLTLAFNIQPVKAEPKTWTVDDDGPADFSSIQEAINSSLVADGDTIFVHSGTYYEQVVVNKSVSLIGAEIAKPTIILNVTEYKFAVYISANNVTVSGFRIRNYRYGGILLNHSSSCIVSENIVKAVNAIFVEGGSGNKISDNYVARPSSCVHCGFDLRDSDNNVITGNYLPLSACDVALKMDNSNHNYIAFNYIAAHLLPPVHIGGCHNNSIVGNTVQSVLGFEAIILTGEFSGNVLYHNNFLTSDWGPIGFYDGSMNNTWDNGYPYGGNYWTNYTGVDINMDGIGDSSYEIDSNNIDRYPLMGMFSDFLATLEEQTYHITAVCNSTISGFQFSIKRTAKSISFNVTGPDATLGFCRVCIPHDLMEPPYTVTIDGHLPQYVNYTLYDNATHRWMYFTYQHSAHEVIIAQYPVGGIYLPVNKLELLAPYIELTILLAVAAVTAGYVKKRKRNT
jgi:parallel beta-helix repeat protein